MTFALSANVSQRISVSTEMRGIGRVAALRTTMVRGAVESPLLPCHDALVDRLARKVAAEVAEQLLQACRRPPTGAASTMLPPDSAKPVTCARRVHDHRDAIVVEPIVAHLAVGDRSVEQIGTERATWRTRAPVFAPRRARSRARGSPAAAAVGIGQRQRRTEAARDGQTAMTAGSRGRESRAFQR